MGDFDVVLSLTSWKDRLKTNCVLNTLRSLVNQKCNCKTHIVLNIFKDDIQYISNDLKQFIQKNNIELLECPIDLKSHKKYYYVMQKYKDKPVILFDDDLIYYDNTVKVLWDNYKKHPNCISARRCHLMRLDSNKKFLPYKKWRYEYTQQSSEPSSMLFPTTGGGTLYPPNCLTISREDFNDIVSSITADDIFLKYKAFKNNILVSYVFDKHKLAYYKQNESLTTKALCFTNDYVNDLILNKLLNKLDSKLFNGNNKDDVNVVYITDKNYLEQTITSIKSLFISKTESRKYCVFVLHSKDLNDNDIIKLKKLNNKNCIVYPLLVITDKYSKFQTKRHVTQTALIKFDIPNLIHSRKVLYLDSDTIILNNIETLYDYDISKYFLCAVRDTKDINIQLLKNKIKNIHNLNEKFYFDIFEKHLGYFNSGVMIMNLELMRKYNISEKLFDYRTNGENYFMDQDALNVCLGDNVLFVPLEYNFQMFIPNVYTNKELKTIYNNKNFDISNNNWLLNNVKILHLSGQHKPWNENIPFFTDLYNKFKIS